MSVPPINLNAIASFNNASADQKAKWQKGFVNFGDPKLNTNTTTAKGLEKVIAVIYKFIIKAQGSVLGIIYGKFQKQNSSNPITKAIDRGISNILEDVVSVDLCNLLSYAINEIPGGKQFNPEEPPPSDSPFALSKWRLQKSAYDVQKKIDDYYTSYGDAKNPDSKFGLYNLTKDITEIFNLTNNPNFPISNPELNKAFPSLSIASNFLTNSLSLFNRYTDLRQIPNEELQKIIRTIDQIRVYTIAIQGLNTPASFVNLADSILGGDVQKQIEKINKIITPTKLIPLLKQILKVANNLNSLGTKLISYITTAQGIIKIAIILIRVFDFLIVFFKTLALPSQFTTAGIQTTFSDTVTEVFKERGKKKLVKRLAQINVLLGAIAGLAQTMIIGIYDIIQKLNLILLNLENCVNAPSDLKEEIQQTIDNLSSTVNRLQDFLDRYNNAQDSLNRTFGEYVIEIVTEEIVDDGISIRRRFGIARDTNGYIVAQSTPTFASLDLIIINEVKLILSSKGLVKTGLNSLSPEETITISESLKYLDEQDISIDSVELNTSELNNLEENEQELGLQSFLNNLPGGKALRKRVRKILAKQNQNLTSNLNSVDPNSKYKSNIIKQ
jgi:predicted PurR-regulated permease PerM